MTGVSENERWTLWENSRGDLKVDGPHLAKVPGEDGIGYVEPVEVVPSSALRGAVERAYESGYWAGVQAMRDAEAPILPEDWQALARDAAIGGKS